MATKATTALTRVRRRTTIEVGELTMSVTAVRPSTVPAPRDTGIRPRRWTRKEYYRAAELGLFRPDERLELLDGEILQKMSPQKPPHAVAISNTAAALSLAFGPGFHARQQLLLVLDDESEPEPDVLVVPGR